MSLIHLPRGPRKGDELDVDITDIDPTHGAGIGHLEVELGPQHEHRIYPVLVPKTVPGDRVRVEVIRYRKRKVEGRIGRILSPSPMRIEPRCKHFGSFAGSGEGKGCGGCVLQSLDYRHQLSVKERLVKKLMKDAGIDPGLVHPTRGLDEPWYYRNKMEFSFGAHEDGTLGLGLHPSGMRFEVIDLEECFLQSSFVAPFLAAVRQWARAEGLEAFHFKRNDGWLRTLTIREGKRTGQRLVELTTSHAETCGPDARAVAAAAEAFTKLALQTSEDLGAPLNSIYWTRHRAVRGEPTRRIEEVMHGAEYLAEELHLLGDDVLRFRIHPRAFFQPNTRQAEELYARVVERAELDGGERLLDLYCGTGTIGMALSPWADSVVGVEMQADAVDNARENARLNDIDHIEFICGDVSSVLQERTIEADVIIVDPPRAGLMPKALEHIDAIEGARRLVYVSCNPKALARDLVLLHERGWTTSSIEPVDMFAHTYHIENVTLLTR